MPFPLSTLSFAITPAGPTAPTYSDILSSLKASAQNIFGADVYLEPDSQDGQLLAIFAQSIHDANQAGIAVYNSYSPATAVGVGLSNAVKINNIKRLVATNSEVNVTIGGNVGTTITSGVVGDGEGNRWLLPMTVIIPIAGDIIVTATAEQVGEVSAPPGSITRILTPTAGWQTVTNVSAATLGQPVESDAQLRARQEISPSIYSFTPLSALAGALNALPGVTYGMIYENDTATTDSNGVPAYSIAVVIKGGNVSDIAHTIYSKKAPGIPTYGTSTQAVVDIAGVSRDIHFSIPAEIAIKCEVTIHADTGYTSAIGVAIQQAVTDYINGLTIGADVIVTRLFDPALLRGDPRSLTYRLVSVTAAFSPAGTLGTTDLTIGLTEKATCLIAHVTLTIV
jgi:uncharacterized phage protein gp47/JayE